MTIRATVKGNRLVLTADNLSRNELAYYFRHYGYNRVESEISDELHDKWEFIAPEIVGALTSSPILCNADGIDYSDDGYTVGVLPDGIVAWFPDYQVICPWKLLWTRGKVEFTITN